MGYNTAMLRRKVWTAQQEAREWKASAMRRERVERTVFDGLGKLDAPMDAATPVTVSFRQESASVERDLAFGFLIDYREDPEKALWTMLRAVNELLAAALERKQVPSSFDLRAVLDYDAYGRRRRDRFNLYLASWRRTS